jgi:hypothetical protein
MPSPGKARPERIIFLAFLNATGGAQRRQFHKNT